MTTRYLISKDGKNLGPYSLDEIRSRIGSLQVSQEDLVWVESDNTWQPIKTLLVSEAAPSPKHFTILPEEGTALDKVLPTRWVQYVVVTVFGLILFLIVRYLLTPNDVITSPSQPASHVVSRDDSDRYSRGQPTSDFTVTDTQFQVGRFGNRTITGTLTNNGNRTYGYAQVEINLYDATGDQVGSTIANVNNIEPGKSWKFEAAVLADTTSTFKVMHISAF